MKKKIKKIIEKYIEIKNKIDEDDYDKRMCEAEDTIVKIQTIVNQPKVVKQPKQQLYCNFELQNHYAADGEKYYTWRLVDITIEPYGCIRNNPEDVSYDHYNFCSVKIENYLKDVK